MKHLSLLFSVVFLAALVICGSGGFTFSKIVCLTNACATSYTLSTNEDCCDNRNETAESNTVACCKLIDITFSLDEFSVSESAHISANQVSLFLIPIFAFNPSFNIHHSSFILDPSPPVLQNYLHFTGALLL